MYSKLSSFNKDICVINSTGDLHDLLHVKIPSQDESGGMYYSVEIPLNQIKTQVSICLSDIAAELNCKQCGILYMNDVLVLVFDYGCETLYKGTYFECNSEKLEPCKTYTLRFTEDKIFTVTIKEDTTRSNMLTVYLQKHPNIIMSESVFHSLFHTCLFTIPCAIIWCIMIWHWLS